MVALAFPPRPDLEAIALSLLRDLAGVSTAASEHQKLAYRPMPAIEPTVFAAILTEWKDSEVVLPLTVAIAKHSLRADEGVLFDLTLATELARNFAQHQIITGADLAISVLWTTSDGGLYRQLAELMAANTSEYQHVMPDDADSLILNPDCMRKAIDAANQRGSSDRGFNMLMDILDALWPDALSSVPSVFRLDLVSVALGIANQNTALQVQMLANDNCVTPMQCRRIRDLKLAELSPDDVRQLRLPDYEESSPASMNAIGQVTNSSVLIH